MTKILAVLVGVLALLLLGTRQKKRGRFPLVLPTLLADAAHDVAALVPTTP